MESWYECHQHSIARNVLGARPLVMEAHREIELKSSGEVDQAQVISYSYIACTDVINKAISRRCQREIGIATS